jgi:hypothetical protein
LLPKEQINERQREGITFFAYFSKDFGNFVAFLDEMSSELVFGELRVMSFEQIDEFLLPL